MLLSVLICCTSSVAHADVHMMYRRTLDGKALRADSLLVECPQLGIRFTTKDTVFSIKATVDVPIESAGSAQYRMCDVYDVRGALRAHNVRVPAAVGKLWLSDTYGLVITEDTAPSPSRRATSQAAILEVPTVKLTAWRLGYAPSLSTFSLPVSDTSIVVPFDLLPWWQRIATVHLVISDSVTYVHTSRQQSQNGGSQTQTDDTTHVTHYISGGHDGYAYRPLLWTATDTSITYFYSNDPNVASDLGLRINCTMKLDSSLSRVTALSIRMRNYEGQSMDESDATVRELPSFSTTSTTRMIAQCSGAEADRCFVSAGGYTRRNYETSPHSDINETRFYLRHSPNGISIKCTIDLRE
jgi:hypothetical protein